MEGISPLLICVTLTAAGRSSGEGPIYATVARRSGSAGPAPPSPLSASMDSGISSAGRRQGSPSPGARRRELDDLLRDMMRTVEALPGGASTGHSAHSAQPPPEDIPYHARPDSRPFAYTTPPDAAMLRCQPHLSSPSLVRKALNNGGTYPNGNGITHNDIDNLDKIFDQDPIDSIFTADANESFRRRERREALNRAGGTLGRAGSPAGSRVQRASPSNALAPPTLSPVVPRKESRLKREEQITTVTTTRTPPYENLYSG